MYLCIRAYPLQARLTGIRVFFLVIQVHKYCNVPTYKCYCLNRYKICCQIEWKKINVNLNCIELNATL